MTLFSSPGGLWVPGLTFSQPASWKPKPACRGGACQERLELPPAAGHQSPEGRHLGTHLTGRALPLPEQGCAQPLCGDRVSWGHPFLPFLLPLLAVCQ